LYPYHCILKKRKLSNCVVTHLIKKVTKGNGGGGKENALNFPGSFVQREIGV
jgi:hypothetical protein